MLLDITIYESHDIVSGNDIIPCNQIDKQLMVYRSSKCCIKADKTLTFSNQKCDFKVDLI